MPASGKAEKPRLAGQKRKRVPQSSLMLQAAWASKTRMRGSFVVLRRRGEEQLLLNSNTNTGAAKPFDTTLPRYVGAKHFPDIYSRLADSRARRPDPPRWRISVAGFGQDPTKRTVGEALGPD